jgi:uncharacterized protein YecE (DUF72 family)
VSGQILVGTASWSDPGFVERWYPKKMPAGERMGWYAQHFDLVEVNSTFYSVPEPRMVERWCSATPDDFVQCKVAPAVFISLDAGEAVAARLAKRRGDRCERER